jgi:hypothetical protein
VTRFLLDSGIAGDTSNRRKGVYEQARAEVARGNPVAMNGLSFTEPRASD